MRIGTFYKGASVLFLGMLFSCNNNESPLIEQEHTNYTDVFEQTIKFDGNIYHVHCATLNDSLIFLDKNFESIYRNQISKMPELTTFVYKDENGNDVIEYYSSEKELLKSRKISFYDNQELCVNTSSRAITMPEPKAGRAILYDDTGFKDRTVTLDADYNQFPSIANLKAYAGFNDKTSAIRVFDFLKPDTYYRPSYAVPGYSVKGSQLRTCLIGYEDSDFKGSKLFCVATYSSSQDINKPETASHQDYKLKNIGWNDKISSCVFRIITVDDINNGTITPHN